MNLKMLHSCFCILIEDNLCEVESYVHAILNYSFCHLEGSSTAIFEVFFRQGKKQLRSFLFCWLYLCVIVYWSFCILLFYQSTERNKALFWWDYDICKTNFRWSQAVTVKQSAIFLGRWTQKVFFWFIFRDGNILQCVYSF